MQGIGVGGVAGLRPQHLLEQEEIAGREDGQRGLARRRARGRGEHVEVRDARARRQAALEVAPGVQEDRVVLGAHGQREGGLEDPHLRRARDRRRRSRRARRRPGSRCPAACCARAAAP